MSVLEFYVYAGILVLKARLLGKVHQAPHEKTMKSGTSQAMK
jgi:hypothetical protein